MKTLIIIAMIAITLFCLMFIFVGTFKSKSVKKPMLIIDRKANIITVFIVIMGMLFSVTEIGFRMYKSNLDLFSVTKSVFLIVIFSWIYYLSIAKIYFDKDRIVYGNGEFKYSDMVDMFWFDRGFAITCNVKKNQKKFNFVVDMKYKDQIKVILRKKTKMNIN